MWSGGRGLGGLSGRGGRSTGLWVVVGSGVKFLNKINVMIEQSLWLGQSIKAPLY